MIKPETWTRYPRSLDAEKDRAALMARLNTMKEYARFQTYDVVRQETMQRVLDLCIILDQEHDDWIAQRGIEAVKEAVL